MVKKPRHSWREPEDAERRRLSHIWRRSARDSSMGLRATAFAAFGQRTGPAVDGITGLRDQARQRRAWRSSVTLQTWIPKFIHRLKGLLRHPSDAPFNPWQQINDSQPLLRTSLGAISVVDDASDRSSENFVRRGPQSRLPAPDHRR